jgi:hypothetical protein
MRVMAADMDLAVAMLDRGWCKPAQAESATASDTKRTRTMANDGGTM